MKHRKALRARRPRRPHLATPGCLAALLAGMHGHAAASLPLDAHPAALQLSLALQPVAHPAFAIPLPPQATALLLRTERALAAGQPARPDGPLPSAPPPPQALAMLLATRRTAAAPVIAGEAPRAPGFLLLVWTVNGQKQDDVVRAERTPAGELLLAQEAWRAARLRASLAPRQLADGTPAFSLDALPGASYRLQRSELHLDVTVPADAFEATVLDRGQRLPEPDRPRPGALLNYDLAASTGSGGSAGAALLEGVALGAAGTFTTSGLASTTAGGGFHRLESAWRYDRPGDMQSLVVGDTIAAGGAWSRPVRFGGVRVSRDFGLRPGFVTLPQVTIAGDAALPSTVDVLVNNSSRISGHVQPGPLAITDVPVVTGAGQVSLVVRDLLGREQVVTQNYYASPSILARGLLDYSFEAGWLREGFGQDARYGDAFASATLRRGLTDALTGEGRVELQADRRAAGAELAAVVAGQAVARASLAVSSHDRADGAETGRQLQAGLERSTASDSLFASYQAADRGFAPLGEADDAAGRGRRVREQFQVGASRTLPGSASIGASLVRQQRWNGDDFRLAALTLNMPVAGRGVLTVAANRRLAAHAGWDLMVSVGFPLDGRTFAEARATRSAAGGFDAGLAASQAAPVGPGWGWRVESSTLPGQAARAAASYNTTATEATLEAAASSGGMALRGSLRGAVGVLDALPFATTPVRDQGFAVVETGGLADIPISVGHQVVARTDGSGRAFVPNLLPWQRNALQVDAADLPMDVHADPAQLTQEVVPHARSGHVVRFPLHRVRQALVVPRTPEGGLLAPGASVRAAGRDYVAGKRGEVWLADLPAGPVRLEWSQGRCASDLGERAAAPGERLELRCGT